MVIPWRYREFLCLTPGAAILAATTCFFYTYFSEMTFGYFLALACSVITMFTGFVMSKALATEVAKPN